MMERIGRGEPVPIFARNEEEFDQVMGFVFTHPPFVPSPVKRVIARRAAAYYPLNMQIFEDVRTRSVPFESLAAGLRTPTLIVWGDNDRVLHVSGAEVLRRLLPNSQVVIMHGVGHVPMLEDPKQVAEDYIAFRNTLKP
jgi:pimeloyl-ACP methyl ester carboxylesterase